MSLEEVANSVQLDPSHLFNHRPILREEIENFGKAFVQSDLEFDNLIQKNHRVYEANETAVLPLLQSTTLKSLATKLDAITKQITRLSKPIIHREALHKVNLSTLTQTEIFKLAEQEMSRRKQVETMEKIIEME